MRLKVSVEMDIELLHITGKQMVLQDYGCYKDSL